MKKAIPKSKHPLPQGKPIGLRVKPQGNSAWARMPFVGDDHHKLPSCWDVPLTGGFFGGLDAGKTIARMFIKYLRDQKDDPLRMGASRLRMMFTSLELMKPSTPDEQHSLNGQRAGFISELFEWIDAAAMRHGAALDAIPQRSFIQQVNEHLVRTDHAYMAAVNSVTP
ncbi:hypothetical protein PMM47T1_24109 [Pseudomonas sp. M47T1]|uniref:hypothetical protein n=1 Tax=Pseudomonas sp. M47T1 TaxID=1179778 RepID=UPI0002607DFD|nr:hypothetical protein [Pseudomonas sp. M47T1]EIK94034.1 hypothetical protein PMM47T1_24109 [Pseudomonas sp. M47T1]